MKEFVFSDSFPSPLISRDPSAPHRISPAFDSGPAPPRRNCVSAMLSPNAIRVNNCKLSRRVPPAAFDVLEVIKSAFLPPPPVSRA